MKNKGNEFFFVCQASKGGDLLDCGCLDSSTSLLFIPLDSNLEGRARCIVYLRVKRETREKAV